MYTILAVLSVLIVIILDRVTGTRLLQDKRYYVFLGLIAFFKLLVNGALTAHIVIYDPSQITGIRIMTIPIEDFGFGFSMVTLAVLVWEKSRSK